MAFKPGHGTDSRLLTEWIESHPSVKEWFSKKRPGTARKYATALRAYFVDHLQQTYETLDAWVNSVKKAQSDPDFEVQTAWAKELEDFITTKKLKDRSRRGFVAGITSFLEKKIGTKNAHNYKFSYSTYEERDSENHESDTTTISYDDILKLVHVAKSKRDRALILTNLSGLGVGEILDFNAKWFQIYKVLKSRPPDVRWKTAVKPVRVDLVRHKRKVKFYTMMVDDQIDALADLLDERESKMGRPLTKDDPLFVNYRDEAMTEHRIQEQIRFLRDNAAVEHPERIRVHEIGRDCFITMFANHGIGPFDANGKSLPAEFCTGHQIDDLKYNKAAWTPQGEANLREIFERLRPTMNLITGRGREPTILTADAAELQELKSLVDGLLRHVLPSTKHMTQEERVERAKKLLLGEEKQLKQLTEKRGTQA
jgi:hypothetical protein